MTISHPPGVRLPLLPLPGLQLPSQLQSITIPWLVPSYTAWWQRHICVNNLLKVVKQILPRVGFEPTTCWSNALPIAPPQCPNAPNHLISFTTWYCTKKAEQVELVFGTEASLCISYAVLEGSLGISKMRILPSRTFTQTLDLEEKILLLL